MDAIERGAAAAETDAKMIASSGLIEQLFAQGVFVAECFDKDGNLKWRDEFKNTVMTAGKNLALDTILAGSAYTVVGPYMGLISSASYSAISAADVLTSHAGWLEAGNANAPTYTGSRKTMVFSAAAAGSKALSSALAFAITGTGTIKGVFTLFGTGATNTVDDFTSGHGIILSAGLFSGGDRAVLNGDTVNVSWSLGI